MYLNRSFFLGIEWFKSVSVGFGKIHGNDLKILCRKFLNFDFSGLFDPSKLKILSKSAKILLFSNLLFKEKSISSHKKNELSKLKIGMHVVNYEFQKLN